MQSKKGSGEIYAHKKIPAVKTASLDIDEDAEDDMWLDEDDDEDDEEENED